MAPTAELGSIPDQLWSWSCPHNTDDILPLDLLAEETSGLGTLSDQDYDEAELLMQRLLIEDRHANSQTSGWHSPAIRDSGRGTTSKMTSEECSSQCEPSGDWSYSYDTGAFQSCGGGISTDAELRGLSYGATYPRQPTHVSHAYQQVNPLPCHARDVSSGVPANQSMMIGRAHHSASLKERQREQRPHCPEYTMSIQQQQAVPLFMSANHYGSAASSTAGSSHSGRGSATANHGGPPDCAPKQLLKPMQKVDVHRWLQVNYM
eukprot:jgi/Tetstr1/463124/TSEL_008058.t1